MTPIATLLQWHYLIFLLPAGVSALLLLLSSVRMGHHGGHAQSGHHSAGHGPGHPHAPASGAHPHATGAARPGHATGKHAENGARRQVSSSAGLLLRLMGVGRAPLPMVLEAFFLAWGFCGFFANEILIPAGTAPGLIAMAPSLGAALAGGAIGARFASELISRLMPPEETLAVSRDGLFGMTGKIAFPVSVTAGRIHIYDSFGTLHDEGCRVAGGHPPIGKGRNAMVIDIDLQGNLIVEEVPDLIR